jgi:hypothetical protein
MFSQPESGRLAAGAMGHYGRALTVEMWAACSGGLRVLVPGSVSPRLRRCRMVPSSLCVGKRVGGSPENGRT